MRYYRLRPGAALPVFDQGRARSAADIEHHAFSNRGSPAFHRTAADQRAPRSNHTAQLMGDPAPGRSAMKEQTR